MKTLTDNRIRRRRIYPSSGPTADLPCVRLRRTPIRLWRINRRFRKRTPQPPTVPHPLHTSPTLPTLPPRFPSPRLRRRYCSSCTYPTEIPRVYGILLIMPNKHNFQKSLSKLSAVIAATYNEKNNLSTKKSKPKTGLVQFGVTLRGG